MLELFCLVFHRMQRLREQRPRGTIQMQVVTADTGLLDHSICVSPKRFIQKK